MSKGINLLDILADSLLEPEFDTSTVLIQAHTAKLPTPEKVKAKKGKSEWKLAIALPDTQIGFRKYEDGTLDPFHDVHAINVAMQIVAAMEEEHGIDKMINLGDTLDLPMFGKYATFLVEREGGVGFEKGTIDADLLNRKMNGQNLPIVVAGAESFTRSMHGLINGMGLNPVIKTIE
jgi:hypothetical protein